MKLNNIHKYIERSNITCTIGRRSKSITRMKDISKQMEQINFKDNEKRKILESCYNIGNTHIQCLYYKALYWIVKWIISFLRLNIGIFICCHYRIVGFFNLIFDLIFDYNWLNNFLIDKMKLTSFKRIFRNTMLLMNFHPLI